jgi:hypothetical protein
MTPVEPRAADRMRARMEQADDADSDGSASDSAAAPRGLRDAEFAFVLCAANFPPVGDVDEYAISDATPPLGTTPLLLPCAPSASAFMGTAVTCDQRLGDPTPVGARADAWQGRADRRPYSGAPSAQTKRLRDHSPATAKRMLFHSFQNCCGSARFFSFGPGVADARRTNR